MLCVHVDDTGAFLHHLSSGVLSSSGHGILFDVE